MGNKKTCRTCIHRQRWECGSKIIQYCSVIKSRRTENGLKKIKCKDDACPLYKDILEEQIKQKDNEIDDQKVELQLLKASEEFSEKAKESMDYGSKEFSKLRGE